MENFPQKLTPEELHELADDKRIIRGAIKDIGDSKVPQKIREEYFEKHQGILGALKEKSEGLIESYGGITQVKEALRATQTFDILAKHFEENTVRKFEEHTEAKEAYGILATKHIGSNVSWGTARSSLAQDILHDYQESVQEEEVALIAIGEDEPTLVRAHELLSYREALSKEGHICPLPSTLEYIRKIENRMITGKPVFLHGATGTGKTSLARYAAKELTGKDAEMVYCSPQFREQQVWSTTGLKASEDGKGVETVVIYGPLSRAIAEGKVIIFDEFTTIQKEQMASCKGLFGAKVGDPVTIPGNGTITMQKGFQMIFTANLKSEKNQERSDLPPEVASEFEQNNIEIGYASAEEMYDTMLARLLDKKGNITLSYEDLQDTLPRFVSAIKEVQIAYAGVLPYDEAEKLGAIDKANEKIQGLKKFVMSQRSIEAIISRWNVEEARDNDTDFKNFLDDALQTGITFKEYPEADRALVAKIFASKGFLKTKSESDLGLKAGSLKGLLAQSEYEEAKKRTLSIKDVAELDPFNVRKSKAQEDAESFVKEEEEIAPTSTELAPTLARVRDAGYLDTSFEGKETHHLAIEALPNEEAIERYKKSGGKTWVWDEMEKNMPYTTPKAENLDVMIMNFNKSIGSDEAIAEMDRLGVRPLTYEELIQYGIAHPAHQEQKVLIGLGSKHTLGGNPRAPILSVLGVERDLDANHWGGDWDDRYRFPVVRK